MTAVQRRVLVPMPRPGDRFPGYFVGPSRCWTFVFDHNLQSTHC